MLKFAVPFRFMLLAFLLLSFVTTISLAEETLKQIVTDEQTPPIIVEAASPDETKVETVPFPKSGLKFEKEGLSLERRFIELERRLLDREADTISWWLNFIVGFLTIFMTALLVGFAFVGLGTKRTLDEIREEATERLSEIKEHQIVAEKKIEDMANAQEAAVNHEKAEQFIAAVENNPTASIVEQAVAEAHDLQRKGFFEEARQRWQDIANLTEGINDRIASTAWFSTGYFWQEKYKADGTGLEEAMNAYNRAISLDPMNAVAYSNRGGFRARIGETEEGRKDLDKAILLAPEYPEAYAARGALKSQMQDFPGAIADFSEAIRIAPSNAEFYTGRGVANQAIGNSTSALHDLNESLIISPEYSQAYVARGLIRREIGDDEGAFSDLSLAIKHNPSLFAAIVARAFLSLQLGKIDYLLRDVQSIVRLKDEPPDTNFSPEGNEVRSEQIALLIKSLKDILSGLNQKGEKIAASVIEDCLEELE